MHPMNKKEKAKWITTILDNLFPSPSVPLLHSDPYTLLIAVLLSAQCTDRRVNEITPRLFAKASNPAAMAALPVAEIRQIIRPCGLSERKARAVSELSRLLVQEHGAQ